MGPLRRWPWLAASVLLAACSEGDNLKGSFDSSFEPDPDGVAEGTLRIDVTPPAGVTDPDLRPQTHLAYPGRYAGLDVQLRPTVEVYGTLTAEIAHPWSAASVPTEILPFAGTVQASLEVSLQKASATADETGTFRMPIVADNFYGLAIVPDDASASPLVALSAVDLQLSTDLSRTLPLGTPVYGRVTDAEGLAVAGAPVRIHRSDSVNDTPSNVVHTDRTGWYTLRVAEPGTYVVEVVGGRTDEDRVLPGVQAEVVVGEEEATAYLDVGALTEVDLSGSLRDPSGGRVGDARVRATSLRLDGSDGALSLETETDENGAFTLRLLPGRWSVEYVPAYSDAPVAGPLGVQYSVAEDTSVGSVTLPGLRHVRGTVTDGQERGVGDALLTLTQTGYGRHVYSAITKADGSYDLEVPDTTYELTVFPPAAATSAVTTVVVESGEDGDVVLQQGEPVSGVLSYDGVPVQYALVEVRDARTARLLGTTTSDGEGRFAVEVVVPEVAPQDDTGSDTEGADTGDTGGTATTGTETTDTGGSDTGGSDSGGTDSGGGSAR